MKLTLEELKKKKQNGDKLTKKETFRLYSSAVSRNNQSKGWTNAEDKVRELLDEMGRHEYISWWHNYKLHNPEQNNYYSLDFMFPEEKVVIEVSPKVWHKNLGNVEEKDKKRSWWLKRLGYKVYIVDDQYLNWKKEGTRENLKEHLCNILNNKAYIP